MASVEELLNKILGALLRPPKPTKLIAGFKDDIDTSGSRLTDKITLIHDVVLVKCRSLGTGTYIALGTEDEQAYRLNAVDQECPVDFIDDLRKVVVITDAGNTGAVEWIGG